MQNLLHLMLSRLMFRPKPDQPDWFLLLKLLFQVREDQLIEYKRKPMRILYKFSCETLYQYIVRLLVIYYCQIVCF